jgi:hypothetical protein
MVNFATQSGYDLPSCNFHGELAKDMNFEPKLDNCTAAN